MTCPLSSPLRTTTTTPITPAKDHLETKRLHRIYTNHHYDGVVGDGVNTTTMIRSAGSMTNSTCCSTRNSSSGGGVEEKKEDDVLLPKMTTNPTGNSSTHESSLRKGVNSSTVASGYCKITVIQEQHQRQQKKQYQQKHQQQQQQQQTPPPESLPQHYAHQYHCEVVHDGDGCGSGTRSRRSNPHHKTPPSPPAVVRKEGGDGGGGYYYSNGGGEEKYHDREDDPSGGGGSQTKKWIPHVDAPEPPHNEDEERDANDDDGGFRSQIENLARLLFGSCITGTCHHPAAAVSSKNGSGGFIGEPFFRSMNFCDDTSRAPLSVVDELRALALKKRPNSMQANDVDSFVGGGAQVAAAGGVFIPNKRRKADVPKYLAEQAIANSFDDDNISAISQHTLDDMYAKHGTTSYNSKYTASKSAAAAAPVARPAEDVPMFSASFFTSVFPTTSVESPAPLAVEAPPAIVASPTAAITDEAAGGDAAAAATTTITSNSSCHSSQKSHKSSPRHQRKKIDANKKKRQSRRQQQVNNNGDGGGASIGVGVDGGGGGGGYNFFRYLRKSS